MGLAKEDIADDVVPGRGVPFGMAGMVNEHNFPIASLYEYRLPTLLGALLRQIAS